MTRPIMRHSGRCRCGGVSAGTDAESFWTSYCHCRDCRRQTGAPVLAFVGFRESELVWTGEARSWGAAHAARSFCGTCGSQIAYRDDRLPGEVYLTLGFMDHPERYPPTLHAFAGRQLPFLHIEDGLPRHAAFSVAR